MIADSTTPHPAFEPVLIGQVIEWSVWSHLVAASEGDLRVFLPTRDMGIDGVVQRHSTGQLVPVQVKGRTRLESDILRVHVQKDDVRDDAVVVVIAVVNLDSCGVQGPLVVASAAQLRERAHLIDWGGRDAYSVEIPWPPGHRTRWADLCVAPAELAERVAPRAVTPVPVPSLLVEPRTDKVAAAVTGFVGEMALLHHAALSPRLNTFHAAPDTGFVEYVVRNVDSNSMRGFQVKCLELTAPGAPHDVHVCRRTLSHSARDRLLIFLRRQGGDVISPCLLIPEHDVMDMASPTSDGRLLLEVHPNHLGRLAPFALPLEQLPARLEE